MSIQAYIGIIYLLIVIGITTIFLLVWRGSKTKTDPQRFMPRLSRAGTIWILVLIIIAVAFTLATRPLIHYPGVARAVPEQRQIMTVEGLQFGWVIEPKQVKAGIPVEFQVSSRDVNHGFGVVDSNGVLLFQVQSMPRYVNKAIYTFEKSGTYRVVCLEYCGLAHHVMIATIEVVP